MLTTKDLQELMRKYAERPTLENLVDKLLCEQARDAVRTVSKKAGAARSAEES